MPVIDNFEGVKEIKNYCIASLIDNGYGTGDISAGVLQLYNKLDGHPIDKEDVARVLAIARFLGALTKKAQDITNTLTLVIGMTQTIKEGKHEIFQLDSAPSTGVFD